MDLVLRTSVVSVSHHAWRRLATIAERIVARARAIVAAVENIVPSSGKATSMRTLERQRERQKAFGAFWLGGRGFYG